MKKKGRGRDWQKALVKNLNYALTVHKKIITSKAKAKELKSVILKEHGGKVRTVSIGRRRGDNSPQVLLEWEPAKNSRSFVSNNAEDKSNKEKKDRKKVASR